ncbi:MAG: CBS domain-containing protein [Desulfobacterales bacterium]|nr:CBS domain-containing protein [Desulfobacterales bacterium]MDJ0874671.1 CBS domain-containing protein [Desulfobacterales bacterium]MDJ0882833.1 CBS domain-containing protein [Desulfobacterales bacterium]
MFISKSMTSKVITTRPGATLLEARELLKTHKIRHLPVIGDDKRLLGIITDRDIRSALPAAFYRDDCPDPAGADYTQLTVGDVMTPDPTAISPQDTIEDALLQIQKMRVGAFPVVDDDGFLKGIISVRDLLRAFINVLGIEEPGTLLGILVEEKVGQLKKIVDAITEENISCGSILVSRHWEKDMRAVFAYLLTNSVSRVKRKLTDLGFELLDPMEWAMDRLPQHD